MQKIMQKDTESIITTLIAVGLVTIAFYFIVIRNLLPTAADAPQPAGQHPNTNTTHNNTFATKKYCTRVPPHVSFSSASMAHSGGANILVDGLVSFRHGTASAHEAALETTEQVSNRKDRAKILSRLLAGDSISNTPSPPSKGSTIVISVPIEDISCVKLKRVLYLLATYYNVLLIVAVHPSFERNKDYADILKRLRTDNIVSEIVLPDHRVVVASTVTGRVAFARQVQRIELILDFDPQVKENLMRFGHRVIVYGTDIEEPTKDVSKLGTELLS